MPELSDVRVLVTGDDEADLTLVSTSVAVPADIAQGLSRAVALMRLRDFGVLIADVRTVQDALALLRAARRARPVTRGIVLMPADQATPVHAGLSDGWELVQRSAFALLRHPVDTDRLGALIEDARRDYLAELHGPVPVATPETAEDIEHTRWLLAERRLAAVLRRAVTRWGTRAQGGVEVALLRGVEAVAEATRQANGSPEVLMAIAEALGDGQVEEVGEAA